MRFVRPAVFMVMKSVPQDDAIFEWLMHMGCDKDVALRFADPVGKHTGERGIELAGRRCYLSFQVEKLNPNVQKIRQDIAEYCDNLLKVKHGSVLEHVSFSFAIEGVSRVFTGEMNRHRAGVAISEGSMRFIRYTDIPIVETPLLTVRDDELLELQEKKKRTRLVFDTVVKAIELGYAELQDIWKDELAPESKFADKKHVTSMMRRIVPMGVATGGWWTMNIRALRHICTMRCSEAAEEEIAIVAGKILETMMREEPNLFKDFHPNEAGYWTPAYDKV